MIVQIHLWHIGSEQHVERLDNLVFIDLELPTVMFFDMKTPVSACRVFLLLSSSMIMPTLWPCMWWWKAISRTIVLLPMPDPAVNVTRVAL